MVRLLVFILLITSFPGLGSGQRCAVGEVTQSVFIDQPRPSGVPTAYREVVSIPVVVHVVWQHPSDNIPDEQIFSQLEILNQDYRMLNDYESIVTLPDFIDKQADMEIEFCLATIDPQGNPTNGITRTQTDFENVGDRYFDGRPRICYTDLGGRDAWDTQSYLNIWVGQRENACGRGTFPGEEGIAPEEDGIRIDPNCFGNTGTAQSPYDQGRTATHEIGHYFNLGHLWGSGVDNWSCQDDDGVADTPTQAKSFQGECPQFANSQTCLSVDMYMNFMNYTDDACMAMFTEGQKERLWQTLNGARSSLLESNACGIINANNQPAAIAKTILLGNPVRNMIEVLCPGLERSLRFSLFSVSGLLLERQTLAARERISIPVSHLAPGIYFLEVSSEHYRYIHRIVIAK